MGDLQQMTRGPTTTAHRTDPHLNPINVCAYTHLATHAHALVACLQLGHSSMEQPWPRAHDSFRQLVRHLCQRPYSSNATLRHHQMPARAAKRHAAVHQHADSPPVLTHLRRVALVPRRGLQHCAQQTWRYACGHNTPATPPAARPRNADCPWRRHNRDMRARKHCANTAHINEISQNTCAETR